MTCKVFEVAIFLVACAFAIKYIKKSHYLDDDKPLDIRGKMTQDLLQSS